MDEALTRLFVLALALGLATSTYAAPLKRLERDGTGTGGCGPYYYRGVGGTCVQGDGSRVYDPDPYWTPCDYSQGPLIPEGACASFLADNARERLEVWPTFLSVTIIELSSGLSMNYT
jgi:hypothetical protein